MRRYVNYIASQFHCEVTDASRRFSRTSAACRLSTAVELAMQLRGYAHLIVEFPRTVQYSFIISNHGHRFIAYRNTLIIMLQFLIIENTNNYASPQSCYVPLDHPLKLDFVTFDNQIHDCAPIWKVYVQVYVYTADGLEISCYIRRFCQKSS